jgi:CheY-like chemotaxis protein
VATKAATPVRAEAGERILVVEDEASVRYMMKRTLEEAGYTVLEAANAGEAIEIITRTRDKISLLLTDVVMPGRHGRELSEEAAKLVPDMSVLFTSGYTDGEIERRGLLAPGSAFIQKPLTPAGLVRAVRERLEAS